MKLSGTAFFISEQRKPLHRSTVNLLLQKYGELAALPLRAHPHMLRDTCAVWYLRHGMGLYGVAKILGHSNPTITAKHYAPFVKELENAHIAENKEILAAAKPKPSGKVLKIS